MIVPLHFSRLILGLVVLSSISNGRRTSLECCAILAKIIPGNVFLSTSSVYGTSLASYWSQQEQALQPACIVRTGNINTIATAVRFLGNENHQNPGSCPFAVRSGGHTPFAGSANIQAGITIDLSLVNDIVVSEGRSRIRLGVGNRWGAVNDVLDPLNLATATGRISGVGVGGFTSGGGMSFYSPRLGLTCDAVLNFDVILSSGEIVQANSRVNPDLFRALKGASNNLGIITHIDLPLVEGGFIWGGFYAIEMSNRPQVFSFFEELNNSTTYDPYVSVINTNVFSNGSWYILFHLVNTRPGAISSPVFASLLAIPPLFSTLRQATHGNLTDEFNAGTPVNSRALLATMTFSNSATFMETFFQLANTTSASMTSKVPGLAFTLSFQPWPQTITGRGRVNGGNALGIDATDGDLTNIDLTLYWNDATDDGFIYAETEKLFDAGVKKAKDMGLWNRYLYLNYADKWQKPIRGYGLNNVRMLRRIGRKYDPRQIFQNAVVGGFKLAD
ncbi:hypothetical protein B0O99DRAFT_644446 [Bisporella sp. PMI_857]|nr:hypothetical protein B0O99DRAFT_644446 [Bisporella sp. PMI_857]